MKMKIAAKIYWSRFIPYDMKRIVVIYIKSKWFSLDIDDRCNLLNGLKLSQECLLVTFQTSEVVRYLKSEKIWDIPLIVDLQCIDKQVTQEGKEFRQYKEWKLVSFLKYHKSVADDFKLQDSTVKNCLEAIASLYIQLLEKDPEEATRFQEIELEINKIIYRRQLQGVRINQELTAGLCDKLEKMIYQAKNKLQVTHGIFDPDNEHQQLAYLISKNYSLIKSPLFTFKARRNEDPVCQLLYEMMRNQRDLDSLLFMLSHWGGEERAKPTYFGFGTITSRITVREPAFQNLRKPNREIIIADSGFKLLYVDYSQFEAGILASLSKDPLLIQLYNSDIYSDLAAAVLGDSNKRSDAKVIFYRYIYGDNSLNAEAVSYFAKFKKVQEFKRNIDTELSEKRRIGTSHGNYRTRGDKDCSWGLSHRIQATASLIYKNAVIRVWKEIYGTKFLIPMHDGTLYQVSERRYALLEDQIKHIYEDEFRKVCPGIAPILTTSDKFH